ncbi:MAG: imipenem/basic amino acid-specific outer membrane pore [Arcobacteraceae bacterium]|jgi:imipenem/basic amino acid-specific outer membrane pore
MKNTIKMSLVAAIAVAGLTTTSSAATLAEAFAASTVKGEIKSQYFEKEKATGVDASSSIFTNGGNISLKTGSFNGLTAGVTFQTAHVYSDKNVAAYKGDMDASGSVMSESYLAYTMANTTAKVGRQYISTPLVAGSGSRIFKQSFEAAVLVNTDIADTTIVAAHVTKFQHRTSTDADATDIGNAPKFRDYADGASTVYVKNTSIDGLTVQAQYAQVNMDAQDDITVAYVAADYKLDSATVSVQAYDSDNGKLTGETDGSLTGIRVAGDINGLSLKVGYTTTGDKAGVVNGLGSGADYSFTGSPIDGGHYTADTDSYQLAAGYKIMDIGLAASYTEWDTNGVDKTPSETNLTLKYAFNKDLSAKVMHSSYDNSTYDSRSRVYLSYKF